MNILLFQVFIGGTAQIIQPNETAENGFVHVIDKVKHKLFQLKVWSFCCDLSV